MLILHCIWAQKIDSQRCSEHSGWCRVLGCAVALLLGPGAEAKKLLPTADGMSPAGMLHAMHERMHAKMKAKAGPKAQVIPQQLYFASAAPWLLLPPLRGTFFKVAFGRHSAASALCVSSALCVCCFSTAAVKTSMNIRIPLWRRGC